MTCSVPACRECIKVNAHKAEVISLPQLSSTHRQTQQKTEMNLYLGLVLLISNFAWFGRADDETITNEAEMTISIGNYHGSGEVTNLTLVIGLFGDAAPMTVMNYVRLCEGYKKKGQMLHYVGTPVHRIVPDFVIQMGDVINKDGTGGMSIFGGTFDDEPFIMRHLSAGYLGMANTGKDTNGSQFYITLTRARWLDKKHVVFGKVIKGMDALQEVGEVPASSITAYPRKKVEITACKELYIPRKWTLSEEQLYTESDIKE